MFYVVIRDIEDGTRLDDTVLSDLDAALACYEGARIVCDNDPDEFGGDNSAIVCQCWLYAVAVEDAISARELARTGRGELVLSYSEPDFQAVETP